MKTSSAFLWQLIRSMTANEKLFFKRNFALNGYGSKPLYLKLFDAIAAQKKYNEEAILKKFSPELTKKNIAFQKHYLQQQVSEAIAQYDNRNSTGHDIYNQILLIRVYRKKGLLDEAHALWKKAVVKARGTESYAKLNLLKTEFEKMILFSSVHTSYDDLHSVFKGNIITYTEYAEMITLRDIYTEVLLLKRKAHFDLDDELKQRINLLLERVNATNTIPNRRSFWFRHYFGMSKATLLYLLQDIATAFALLKDAWQDWRENQNFIGTDGEFYIEVLYMINYAGILRGDYSYVQNTFNDQVNELITDPVQRANFEVIKFLAFNKIYNKTAKYDEVEKLNRFMKSRYQQWEPVLNADLNRTTNLSLGIGSFVLEQYDEALYYIKRGITYFKEGVREEHEAVAQILLLLTCYCMNNPKLFDAQYRATYNYFYKRKKKQPFETALVQCLHRTFYMKEIKGRVNEYRKTLAVFEANRDNVVQQLNLAIFNYYGWLESRAQRIGYRQYVERKVKRDSLSPT